MSIGVWFWIIYVVAVLFSAYSLYAPPAWGPRFGGLVSIVLFGLLGIAVFGGPVHR